MVATPNRFNGLFGAAHAAERSGDLEKAKTYYARLVDTCKGSVSDRPELIVPREFLLESRAPGRR